jgi:hypothetical protein
MGVSTKTLTSLKLRVALSRVGTTRLMANPAKVPEAGGACHLINTAVSTDGEDFKPAWKISPGMGLICYLGKDARTPQEWALN